MAQPYKGNRRCVNVRVPAEVHAQLQEIKDATGVGLSEQLNDLVTRYAAETVEQIRSGHPSELFDRGELQKSA